MFISLVRLLLNGNHKAGIYKVKYMPKSIIQKLDYFNLRQRLVVTKKLIAFLFIFFLSPKGALTGTISSSCYSDLAIGKKWV